MRIILADHHEETLWALKTMLQEQPEFDLLGEAEDAAGLLKLSNNLNPDLVLVDCRLPGISIEDLISNLGALNPKPLVVAMSSELEYSRLALKAGADAFVSKGDHPEWLLKTLQNFENRIKIGGE